MLHRKVTPQVASARRLPKPRRIRCAGRAFSLIEVMVVVAVIAMLIAITMPSLKEAQRNSQKLICMTDLRTLGQVTKIYANENNGAYMDLQMDWSDTSNSISQRNPYRAHAYWRDLFLEKYHLQRKHFYSLMNPSWNRDDYWENGSDKEMVMGRMYFGSTTFQSTLYSGLHAAELNAGEQKFAPVFPTSTTDFAMFNILWTDLNKLTTTTSPWTSSSLVTTNHLDPKSRNNPHPEGSHQVYDDGSADWVEWQDMRNYAKTSYELYWAAGRGH
ncbi:MAG: prepilin-type N-terminal cleavage/methylation domain-containing protein [Phycisphaera sp.]|nr:prepilin-type N-terminal cleavage/methylation domain-containing protein [Phycisphaera sp.]